MANNRDLVKELDRSMPAARNAALGTTFDELQQTFNALLAKLDADTGVIDSDFLVSLGITPLSKK